MCLADYIQSEVNLIYCCISANYNKYYNDNYNYNYNYNYNQKNNIKNHFKVIDLCFAKIPSRGRK